MEGRKKERNIYIIKDRANDRKMKDGQNKSNKDTNNRQKERPKDGTNKIK